MNYEQKYNEMVQRARELHESGNALTKQQMEIVCPELAESEDERMRKAALEGIEHLERNLGWDAIGDIDILDVKEYLEKLKEQKPTPDWMPKFLDELRSKKNYFDWDEHRDIEGRILAIINWIAPDYFKRKEEQKPQVQCVDVIKMSALLAADRLASAEMTGRLKERKEILENPEKYGLCKPAEWSEEDKRALNDAIVALSMYANGEIPIILPSILLEDVERLKSLPEKFNIQPKQGWSEEDEKMVLFWNMYYEHEIDDWSNKDVVEHLERFKEWLNNRFKSLRPEPKGKWAKRLEEAQARWKPSEEQKVDLPKWRYATKNLSADVLRMDEDGSIFIDFNVFRGEYYIPLSELRKLPKEE